MIKILMLNLQWINNDFTTSYKKNLGKYEKENGESRKSRKSQEEIIKHLMRNIKAILFSENIQNIMFFNKQ